MKPISEHMAPRNGLVIERPYRQSASVERSTEMVELSASAADAAPNAPFANVLAKSEPFHARWGPRRAQKDDRQGGSDAALLDPPLVRGTEKNARRSQ
jgi:hypothetical protein